MLQTRQQVSYGEFAKKTVEPGGVSESERMFWKEMGDRLIHVYTDSQSIGIRGVMAETALSLLDEYGVTNDNLADDIRSQISEQPGMVISFAEFLRLFGMTISDLVRLGCKFDMQMDFGLNAQVDHVTDVIEDLSYLQNVPGIAEARTELEQMGVYLSMHPSIEIMSQYQKLTPLLLLHKSIAGLIKHMLNTEPLAGMTMADLLKTTSDQYRLQFSKLLKEINDQCQNQKVSGGAFVEPVIDCMISHDIYKHVFKQADNLSYAVDFNSGELYIPELLDDMTMTVEDFVNQLVGVLQYYRMLVQIGIDMDMQGGEMERTFTPDLQAAIAVQPDIKYRSIDMLASARTLLLNAVTSLRETGLLAEGDKATVRNINTAELEEISGDQYTEVLYEDSRAARKLNDSNSTIIAVTNALPKGNIDELKEVLAGYRNRVSQNQRKYVESPDLFNTQDGGLYIAAMVNAIGQQGSVKAHIQDHPTDPDLSIFTVTVQLENNTK